MINAKFVKKMSTLNKKLKNLTQNQWEVSLSESIDLVVNQSLLQYNNDELKLLIWHSILKQ